MSACPKLQGIPIAESAAPHHAVVDIAGTHDRCVNICSSSLLLLICVKLTVTCLTESASWQRPLQCLLQGRYVRFGFAPKEGTNQALVQLRNSLLDDFERGTMGYTDRVLTSLVLVYSPVTHRNKELGSAMHMDVSDFSTLAVGLQHFKGVKGWADSTAMQQGATVADWHLIKPSHASKVGYWFVLTLPPIGAVDF